jgi:hypothetical protein
MVAALRDQSHIRVAADGGPRQLGVLAHDAAQVHGAGALRMHAAIGGKGPTAALVLVRPTPARVGRRR